MEVGSKQAIKVAIDRYNRAFSKSYLATLFGCYGVYFDSSGAQDTLDTLNLLVHKVTNNIAADWIDEPLTDDEIRSNTELVKEMKAALKNLYSNYKKIIGSLPKKTKIYDIISQLNGYADTDTQHKVLLEQLEELRGEIREQGANTQGEELKGLVKEVHKDIKKIDKSLFPKRESKLTQKEYIEALAAATFHENIRKGSKK